MLSLRLVWSHQALFIYFRKYLLTFLAIQANAYVPGWGQTIFQSANEMTNNNIYRQRMNEQQGKLAEERAWWDKKKTSIKEGFMKELDEDSETKPAQTAGSTTSEATPAAPAPGSDDEAVLVEAENSGNSNVGSPKGQKKKGKGKK